MQAHQSGSGICNFDTGPSAYLTFITNGIKNSPGGGLRNENDMPDHPSELEALLKVIVAHV